MPSFLRFLPARRNIIALVGGFLIALLAWWWWTSHKSATAAQTFTPAGELDRIKYAVNNARSWRTTVIGTLNGQAFQTDQDVFCPFESHTTTRAMTASGIGAVTEEFIETQETMFAREGGQPWRSQPNPGIYKCNSGPMAGSASLVDTLDSLKASTRLRKRELLTLDGGTCRLWDFPSASRSDQAIASICVDDLTQLPYELRLGPLHVQYSHWNQPIAIAPPQMR